VVVENPTTAAAQVVQVVVVRVLLAAHHHNPQEQRELPILAVAVAVVTGTTPVRTPVAVKVVRESC